jgi:ABC-type dipeptide/oligopeptide/nickel transport system permease component
MARYIATRVGQAIATLFIVSIVTFALTHLLGDPVRLLLPTTATEAQYRTLRHQLGYDQPVWTQYLHFMHGVLTGNLGTSTTYGEPALTLVLHALKATAALTGSALLLALVIGIPLGIWAGYRPTGLIDRVSVILATTGQAIPGFVLGIAFILLFAVDLHYFPAAGWGSLRTAVLPVVSLSIYAASLIIRMMRSSTREVMAQPFITLARAKGLPEAQLIARHAIRATLVPVITVIGLQFAVLLTGAFVIESVFSVPGMGQLVVTAVQQRDTNVIMASILVAATGFVAINLVTDLAYALIDPRISIAARRKTA